MIAGKVFVVSKSFEFPWSPRRISLFFKVKKNTFDVSTLNEGTLLEARISLRSSNLLFSQEHVCIKLKIDIARTFAK